MRILWGERRYRVYALLVPRWRFWSGVVCSVVGWEGWIWGWGWMREMVVVDTDSPCIYLSLLLSGTCPGGGLCLGGMGGWYLVGGMGMGDGGFLVRSWGVGVVGFIEIRWLFLCDGSCYCYAS